MPVSALGSAPMAPASASVGMGGLSMPCLSLDAGVVRAAFADAKSQDQDADIDAFDFPADENFWRCLQRLVRVIPDAQSDPTFVVERSNDGTRLTVNKAFLRGFHTSWQKAFPLVLTVAARQGDTLRSAVFTANDAVWHEMLLRADSNLVSGPREEVPDGKVLAHSTEAKRSGEQPVQMEVEAWNEVVRLWPVHYGPPYSLPAPTDSEGMRPRVSSGQPAPSPSAQKRARAARASGVFQPLSQVHSVAETHAATQSHVAAEACRVDSLVDRQQSRVRRLHVPQHEQRRQPAEDETAPVLAQRSRIALLDPPPFVTAAPKHSLVMQSAAPAPPPAPATVESLPPDSPSASPPAPPPAPPWHSDTMDCGVQCSTATSIRTDDGEMQARLGLQIQQLLDQQEEDRQRHLLRVHHQRTRAWRDHNNYRAPSGAEMETLRAPDSITPRRKHQTRKRKQQQIPYRHGSVPSTISVTSSFDAASPVPAHSPPIGRRASAVSIRPRADDLVWDPAYTSGGSALARGGRDQNADQRYVVRYAVPPLGAGDATPCTPRSAEAAGAVANFYGRVAREADRGDAGEASPTGSIRRSVLRTADGGSEVVIDPAAVVGIARAVSPAMQAGQPPDQAGEQATLVLSKADGTSTVLSVPPEALRQLLELAGESSAAVRITGALSPTAAADEFRSPTPPDGDDLPDVQDLPAADDEAMKPEEFGDEFMQRSPKAAADGTYDLPALSIRTDDSESDDTVVEVRLDTSLETFVPRHFVRDMAQGMAVAPGNVAVLSVHRGGVIVAFRFVGLPDCTAAAAECARRCQDPGDSMHLIFAAGSRCGQILSALVPGKQRAVARPLPPLPDADDDPPRDSARLQSPCAGSGGVSVRSAASRSVFEAQQATSQLQRPQPQPQPQGRPRKRLECRTVSPTRRPPPPKAEKRAQEPVAPVPVAPPADQILALTAPASSRSETSLPSAISLGGHDTPARRRDSDGTRTAQPHHPDDLATCSTISPYDSFLRRQGRVVGGLG
eukprot:TRINITY_DN1936_c0_g1_i1.p1 TRINITY_DN1936_c0_g1~~TRINITY_DN1936_c0_g1_i1.p1  ORF type:complete len:1025 (+),score=224.68 TRINITY_DN1936_c0_g1_i1:37-3075(+)